MGDVVDVHEAIAVGPRVRSRKPSRCSSKQHDTRRKDPAVVYSYILVASISKIASADVAVCTLWTESDGGALLRRAVFTSHTLIS